MTGKQLKNSILQWAIQGKLVPQDPNDEPASVLLERIREEKERLIKEKKIKRDKNASIIYRGDDNSHYEKFADGTVKCIDEEIPFELPASWTWTRLGSLCTRFSTGPFGTMVHKEDYVVDKGFPIVNPTNIKNNSIDSKNIKLVSELKYEELSSYVLCVNDIVLARRGDLSKCAIVTAEQDGWLAGTGAFFMRVLHIYLPFFILLYSSSYVQEYLIGDSVGTTMNNLNQNLLSRLLVPLPPLAEQQRIVEKIEVLIPIIEKFDNAQTSLNILNVSMNELLKKSILQQAIQGKLVEQYLDDEPASSLLQRIKAEKERLIKEKKIKRGKQESIIYKGDDNSYFEKLADGTVNQLDVPFEIPASWEWVRLRNICTYLHRGKSPKYGDKKELPIIAQKCNQWDKVYTERCLFSATEAIPKYSEEQFLHLDDIIVNSTGGGTVGRTGYIDTYVFDAYTKFVVDSHVTLIRTVDEVVSRYVYYYLISPLVQTGIEDRCSGSTNQIELGTTTISDYIIPLPPILEQNRIVQRIRELYAKL